MAATVFGNIQSLFDGCMDRDKFDVENNKLVLNEKGELPEKAKRVADFVRTLPWNTYSIPDTNTNLIRYFYNLLNRVELQNDDYKAQKQILQLFLSQCNQKAPDALLEKLAKHKVHFFDIPNWAVFFKDMPMDNADTIITTFYKVAHISFCSSTLLKLATPWLRDISDARLIQEILRVIHDHYLYLNDGGAFLAGLEPLMVGLEPKDRAPLLQRKRPK